MGTRHADLLDVAGRRGEPAPVVAVALAEALLGPLAVLSLQLGVHLLLHDLLQDAFDGVADAVSEGGGDGLRDVVVGHGWPGWLNPQDSLRYHDLKIPFAYLGDGTVIRLKTRTAIQNTA